MVGAVRGCLDPQQRPLEFQIEGIKLGMKDAITPLLDCVMSPLKTNYMAHDSVYQRLILP